MWSVWLGTCWASNINALLQLIGRLGLVGALIGAWWYFSPTQDLLPQTIIPATPAPTLNLDLQLVRLYASADQSGWTEEQYQAVAQLLQSTAPDQVTLSLSAHLPDLTQREVLQQTLLDQVANEAWLEATQTIEALLALDPQNPQVNLWLGILLLPESGAKNYLEVSAASPNPSQALAIALLSTDYQPKEIGLQLMEAELAGFAIRFLSLALERDGLDYIAYAYRGLARDQVGGDGYFDIQNAIALAPDDPLGYYALGLHYRQTADYDLSQQAMSDAQLLEPENPALVAELGAAFQLTNNLAEAESWYQQAITLAPDDLRFISLLAAFYADSNYLGAENTAYEMVAQAAQAHPQEATIQTSWGRMQFHQGELEGSAATYALALILDPSNPRTQFYYAETLERLRQYEAALSQYLAVSQTANPYREMAEVAIRRISG